MSSPRLPPLLFGSTAGDRPFGSMIRGVRALFANKVFLRFRYLDRGCRWPAGTGITPAVQCYARSGGLGLEFTRDKRLQLFSRHVLNLGKLARRAALAPLNPDTGQNTNFLYGRHCSRILAVPLGLFVNI